MIYYTLSNSPSGQARPAAGRGDDDEPPKYQYFVLSKSEEHSGLMRIEGGVDSPTAKEAYSGKENILIVKDIVNGMFLLRDSQPCEKESCELAVLFVRVLCGKQQSSHITGWQFERNGFKRAWDAGKSVSLSALKISRDWS